MDNCQQLRMRIGAYAFAVMELGLYLDTHPGDTCALRKRQEFQQIRQQLIDEYEAQYGPYILNSNQVQGDCWSWIDSPWPWECGRGNSHVAV